MSELAGPVIGGGNHGSFQLAKACIGILQIIWNGIHKSKKSDVHLVKNNNFCHGLCFSI